VDSLAFVRRVVTHSWLLNLELTGTRQKLPRRKVAVANNQTLPLLVTSITMHTQEVMHLRVNGRLQHLLSTLANELI
jgi:hypothetical protein